mmetsp:Transcript_2756/g.7002  ORF Transcript_2756/g.7002 Transcript_2756/m.7002 type:complete len:101 (-) Transcript_2756:160-462(-)
MEENATGPDDPWDAAALRNYAGSTVCVVGSLVPAIFEHGGNGDADGSEASWPRAGGPTVDTSVTLAYTLREGFECVQKVALPNWPHCSDALTVWKRRTFR